MTFARLRDAKPDDVDRNDLRFAAARPASVEATGTLAAAAIASLSPSSTTDAARAGRGKGHLDGGLP